MQQEKNAAAPAQNVINSPLRAVTSSPAENLAKFTKKNKKKLRAGSIFCTVLILVSAGVIAMVYFDLGGFKDLAVSALNLDIPSNAQIAESESGRQEMETKQAQINQALAEQAKTVQELERKQIYLAQQEQLLAARQAELDKQEQAFKAKQSSMEAMVSIIEQMDPAVAAKTLEKMKNISDMVRLLTNMSSEKAALILNNISLSVAAQIASHMVK
ncbi:MAG: MotE family protein [Christensenellales bacterium]